ncbi:hypothetical protein MAP00_002234 [Monascus purpureus]|nr:hypothetical protein MAP00_002234 [Monascus purpureus]
MSKSMWWSNLATPVHLQGHFVWQIRISTCTRPPRPAKGVIQNRRSASGRARNSLFGQEFVRTLGLMRDDDEDWTLQKQKAYIHQRLDDPKIPTTAQSTRTFSQIHRFFAFCGRSCAVTT